MLQSYPSPVPRAAENRYPEVDNTRLVIGGCPFYDADLDYARDVLIHTISDNLEAVADAKGVQFLEPDARSSRAARSARRLRASR